VKYPIRPVQRMAGLILTLTTAGSMFGCTSLGPYPESPEARHYVGYVKIQNSYDKVGKITAENVLFVGVKVSQGIEVGVSGSRFLSIPLDCRAVILIQNKTQLQEAVSTISKLGLDKICASEL
jgi:hypothetical protein